MKFNNNFVDHILTKFKSALSSIGYSQQGIEKQITELNNIILMAILVKIVQEKGLRPGEITMENLEQFLQTNCSQDEIKVIVEEEARRIVEEYIEEITKNLADDKKKNFYDQLGDLQKLAE